MVSVAQTSDAWIRARDRYVQDLNEEEQQKFFQASPESLLDDASAAERSHGMKSTTRGVMEKMQPFVTAVEQYSAALDIYSNMYPLALGPIWGSIKVLLHIAQEFGKYFDKLVDMFARIGDVLPRFRAYERLFLSHEPLIQALSVAYLDIIAFCSDAKAVFRRGQRHSRTTLKMTFKLLWKPFDAQFGQRLNAFRDHQKNVEKEAELANMIEAADARVVVRADQRQLEKQRREDDRLRIIAMLNAVDYEAKHRKLQNLRHAGTGEWLFRQGAYVEWRQPGNSAFLCCRGIPGCGKSILASNLVDTLTGEDPTQATQPPDLIYYYCDYADQRTLQLDRILGSLLKQLFLKHQMPEHFGSQLLQIFARGTRSPDENALGDIFRSSVALHSGVCIVFDGIDECEKSIWQELLKIFTRLATLGQCNVKIFLTCVEEGSVAHRLHNAPYIQQSPTATIEDIRAFVTSSVRSRIENRDLRICNLELEQDIVSELVLRANGMFLWVFFQLDDLCESSSDAMIRETLDNLPEGLGDTYRRILIKISKSPSKAKMAQKVFKWATVAKRPLQVEELKEAVAFEPDDRRWNVEKIPHEDLMFESCRGLIIKDEDDETAHFAHHTIRQYLTGGLTTKVDPFFEISVSNADIFAGQTCVAYLSFSDFDAQITSTTPTGRLEHKGIMESGGPLWIPSTLGLRRPMFDIPYRLLRGDPVKRPLELDYGKYLIPKSKPKLSQSTDLEDKYRLLCYAVEYWEPHTRLYPPSDSVSLRSLESLAQHKTLAFEFRPWGPNQHFGPYGCVGCPSPSAGALVAKDLPHISMIHYAAEVGNRTLLMAHYSTGVSIGDYIDHERYHDKTLLIACCQNWIEIVKYLIEQGKYDISDGRAVNAAAAAGHADLLQYLLSLGQYQIKQQGIHTLALAAENGHGAVVGVLAAAGVDLNAVYQQRGRNFLECAAMNNHDSVIRILIQKGAQYNLDVHQKKVALYLAAANGHVAATRALLGSGISKYQIDHSCALHGAAESGHSAIAEVLLGYDADPLFEPLGITLSTKRYVDAPFDLAAKGGHVEVLKSFKDYAKKKNASGSVSSPGYTALKSAVVGGHEKAIRWLVENGADVNALYSGGYTPLSYAIHLGGETAVRALLEVGARVSDSTWISSGYDDIWSLAVDHGKSPVLGLLLESLRGDRHISRDSKRAALLKAENHARKTGNGAATDVLERELELYAAGKIPETLP